LFIYWFVVCLLTSELFPLFASALMLLALVAILFEAIQDVFLSKSVASEAGRKGQQEI